MFPSADDEDQGLANATVTVRPMPRRMEEDTPEDRQGSTPDQAIIDELLSQGEVNEPAPPAASEASAGAELFPLAEPGEYYAGLWSGKPNYCCPFCGYCTLEGSGAVELHILYKIDASNARHLKALEK